MHEQYTRWITQPYTTTAAVPSGNGTVLLQIASPLDRLIVRLSQLDLTAMTLWVSVDLIVPTRRRIFHFYIKPVLYLSKSRICIRGDISNTGWSLRLICASTTRNKVICVEYINSIPLYLS